MLKSLTVKNLAIIDNIQIDFNNGMTVLTGETGAGKSLIIDAIGLLFGDRASTELVRDGEAKTFIEGIFTDYNENVKNLLNEYDIEEEDFLIVRREIYSTGKSIGKINGNSVSVSVLNEFGNYLGNIHTQFDTQKLINPNNYFDFINDEKINNYVNSYKIKLSEFKKADKKYNDLLKTSNEANQKLDFLKYQLNELDKANLNEDEEISLLKESKVYNNYEKIMRNYTEFNKMYNENNILDNIYDSINCLEKLAEFDEDFISKKETLNEIYYNLNDLVYEVNNSFKQVDFDEDEAERINLRLSVYSDLKRKYKMNTAELISYFKKIKEEVNLYENHDVFLNDYKKERDKLFNETCLIADEITNLRKEKAKLLEKDIINSLQELQLKNVSLNITITKGDFKEKGQDLIDFLVSFNKGENVKSLNKIASGGELSRFMLALKELSSYNMKNQTLVFDEIDTGVSGEVAYSIADKINKISKYTQVLCVTHLPQVASICDNHFNITKKFVDNKTVTDIKLLDNDERINVIASMLSKKNITDASIQLAKEMIEK